MLDCFPLNMLSGFGQPTNAIIEKAVNFETFIPKPKILEIFLQPERSLVAIRKYYVQGTSQSRYCLPCHINSKGQLMNRTLRKAQQTPGIKSLNFIKLFKPINESMSNFNLFLFGKGRKKTCHNFDKSMQKI